LYLKALASLSKYLRGVENIPLKLILDSAGIGFVPLFESVILSGKPKQPELPLIRLRIEFDKETELFNLVRFGQKFEGRVANPADLVLMRKKKSDVKVKRTDLLDKETFAEALERVVRTCAKLRLHLSDGSRRSGSSLLSWSIPRDSGVVRHLEKSDNLV